MLLTDEQKTTAYLQRIGITVSPGHDADADLLQKVYRAQVTTVPYENINYLLWDTSDLDPDVLFREIVTERRGGVCYEVTILFGWLLQRLGFGVRMILADHYRIHEENSERKHMGLIVTDQTGKRWWVDPGDSFSQTKSPFALEKDIIQTVDSEQYRFERLPDGKWMEWTVVKDQWIRNMAFYEKDATIADASRAKRAVIDPDNPFMSIAMFGIRTPEGMLFLKDNTLHKTENGVRTARTLAESELSGAYALFGLQYPYTLYRH